VLVEFDRNGSLPTTHDTQGSDMGLCGGLMGWDAVDPRLPESPHPAGIRRGHRHRDGGCRRPASQHLPPHLAQSRRRAHLRGISTGGGMIEVIDIDGFTVSMGGDYFETLLFTRMPRGHRRRWKRALSRCHPAARGGNRQMVEVKAAVLSRRNPLIAVLPGVNLSENDWTRCCRCVAARTPACPSPPARNAGARCRPRHAAVETRGAV
jgi:hypothetical protein